MITIYYKDKTEEYKKILKWSIKNNIKMVAKNIETITEKEIFQLIYLSDLEITDVVVKSSLFPLHTHYHLNRINKMSFSEGLSYLGKHPILLKSPILLSSNVSMCGYNFQKLDDFLLESKVDELLRG